LDLSSHSQYPSETFILDSSGSRLRSFYQKNPDFTLNSLEMLKWKDITRSISYEELHGGKGELITS